MTTAPGEAAFPTLFSPIQVGSVDVRNRVVITSHGTSEAFRHPGMSPSGYIEYLRRRAAGGAGLIICQPILSDPLHSITEETIDRHARIVEAVRAEGATFLLQLTHLGVFARSEADVRRPPLMGFESTQSAAGETAHQMTPAEIELMIEGYRRTAEMAATAAAAARATIHQRLAGRGAAPSATGARASDSPTTMVCGRTHSMSDGGTTR